MPAVSQSQQKFFGMVHAYKKGELDTSSVPADVMKRIRDTAGSIKKKAAKDFASTKHKGLPTHVTENIRSLSFKEFLDLST